MKDGDKGYRSMLPCYNKEKTEEEKECAWVILHPKNDNKNTLFKISIRVTACKIVGTL